MVDDYTTEFYQLLASDEIQETEDQLVSQYIGGLQIAIQDTVNLLDTVNISLAHQRALLVEKQLRCGGSVKSNSGLSFGSGGGSSSSNQRVNTSN